VKDLIKRIAASATGGDAKKPFEEIVPAYVKMGYKQFELYAGGRGSSPDYNKGTAYYKQKAAEYGITYSSLHLPTISASGEDFEKSVKWLKFADELNIPVCVFNAAEKEGYAALLKKMVPIAEKLKPVLVVQIHEGRSLETLEDVKMVLKEVDHPKVKILHELGSYHAIGVSWKKVIDTFWPRIGLFHLKDMMGPQSVPFGTGDVDFAALFKTVESIGYKGSFVLELATKDPENTNKYFAEAFKYFQQFSN